MSEHRSEQNAKERKESSRLVCAALKAGWTKQELADVLGVTPNAIAGWFIARNRAPNAIRSELRRLPARFSKRALGLMTNGVLKSAVAYAKAALDYDRLSRPVDAKAWHDPAREVSYRDRQLARAEHKLRKLSRRVARLKSAIRKERP